MNKGIRQRKTRLKFKKRLKQMGLLNKEGNFYCYKSNGSPCSCPMCSPNKYNRKIKHKNPHLEED